MTVEILPANKRSRTCQQCRAHFLGHQWQRFCRVCWSWRMIGWHVTGAARALRRLP